MFFLNEIYIYIYIFIRGSFKNFPYFFVWAFLLIVHTWKNATETNGMLQIVFYHLAWIEHQLLIGIRDSRKVGSLWGMMRRVGGVRKSIHQSWLAKGLGLGLLCWNFKGSSGRDSLGRGQHSSNSVSSISSRTMHQSTTPSLSQTIWPRWASRTFLSLPLVQTLLPVTFGYSLSLEAVVMRQFRRWKRLWRRSLTRSYEDFHRASQKLFQRYNECIAVGGYYFEED